MQHSTDLKRVIIDTEKEQGAISLKSEESLSERTRDESLSLGMTRLINRDSSQVRVSGNITNPFFAMVK